MDKIQVSFLERLKLSKYIDDVSRKEASSEEALKLKAELNETYALIKQELSSIKLSIAAAKEQVKVLAHAAFMIEMSSVPFIAYALRGQLKAALERVKVINGVSNPLDVVHVVEEEKPPEVPNF